jgi:hypothetical protein
MTKIVKMKLVVPLLLVGLFLVSLACSLTPSLGSEPTATISQPAVITQVVTQIVVVTDTPAPTSPPAVQPTAIPEATSTYDPYSVPVYYPKEDCPGSRIHVGDRAYVSFGGGPNAIRYGADTHYDNIIGYAQEGEGMDIIDGPYCKYGWLVWFVRTDGGLVGFTPEGNGDEYWLLPTNE